MKMRSLIGLTLGALIMSSCGNSAAPEPAAGPSLQAQGFWPLSVYATVPAISSISTMLAYNGTSETYEKFAMRVNFNIVSSSAYSAVPVQKYELIIDDTTREITTFLGDPALYPVGKAAFLETTFFYSGTHKYKLCTYGVTPTRCSVEYFHNGQ